MKKVQGATEKKKKQSKGSVLNETKKIFTSNNRARKCEAKNEEKKKKSE